MQSIAVPFIHFHGHRTVIQVRNRPFVRQRLEIGLNRSGGINSFFTLRSHHPDNGFQHHLSSAIPEACSKHRRAHLQAPSRHDRESLWKNKISREGEAPKNIRALKERKRLIDPQLSGIDKMGRIHIDRELADQIVTIAVSPSET